MKKGNDNDKKYLTYKEALEFTGLSKDEFRRKFCGEDNKFRKVDGEPKIARSVLEEHMNGALVITEEEQKLLDRLENGEFDGPVGDEYSFGSGNTSRMVIENGIPRRYRKKAGCYYSEHYDEMREFSETVKQEWHTDEQKLNFLAKYGFLIDDEAVQRYNQAFKEQADDEW